MRSTFIVAICLTIGSGTLTAQSAGTGAKLQKDVVEKFMKMETDGGRIQPEGWQEARSFFVRSSPFTSRGRIFVIGKSYFVWDPMTIPPGTTTVSVEVDPVGQIDSKLRFIPPARSYYKNSRYFKLVFTDKRWEMGHEGEAAREVTEPSPKWLIDEPNDSLMLMVSSAIRYVSEQRDATSDPIVKKNADVTIAKLKSMH